jgi:hypothetical protein
MGALAVQWLDSQLDRFTPWRNSQLESEGVQALSELAILFVRLMANQGRVWKIVCPDLDASRWRAFIIDQLSRPEIAELPRKRPLHSFPYLLAYLVMRGDGLRDDYWETTLERLQSVGLPMAQEVVPFRRLDVAYFLKRSGFAPAMALESHFRDTFLALVRNEVFVDDDSAYSVTHSLLYLSNFGTEALGVIGESELGPVRRLVESLAVTYWRRGHWDLVGELLISLSICGLSSRSLFAWVFNAFASQQNSDGFFIGRQDSMPLLLSALEHHDGEKIFSLCYHTTLVAAILSAQLVEDPC